MIKSVINVAWDDAFISLCPICDINMSTTIFLQRQMFKNELVVKLDIMLKHVTVTFKVEIRVAPLK